MENISRILKICFAVWLHVIVFICCKSTVFAYTGPDNVEYEYKWEGNVFNGNYVFYSHYPFTYCTNYTTGDYYYLLTGVEDGNGNVVLISFNIRTGTYTAFVNAVEYPTGSTLGGQGIVGTLNGGTFANNWVWAVPLSSLSNTEGFSTKEECYEYITTSNIDFDNPYYNPLLVVPEIEVKYTMDIETDGTPVIPLSVALKNANSNYYVEVVCVNYMPSIVNVKWQEYSALFSHKFAQHNLVSHDVLKISSDLSSSDIGNALNIAWLQDVTNYPVSEVGFINDIGTDTNSLRAYNNMVDNYEIARKVGCFYGNNTEIYVRYFTIEDETKFVVSAWRTWTSQYSENFGIQLPSYYQTYSVASGYENTNQNTSVIISPTSVPDSVNPSNNYGTKKGSPITINIGQNVPNYPDYPTIATYNLDNMLVSTMNQGESIGGFLTGIAGFASAALAFIPDYVWQLVAFGLGLSIVVMFLKIL